MNKISIHNQPKLILNKTLTNIINNNYKYKVIQLIIHINYKIKILNNNNKKSNKI
jgi:hypothetical protein